MFWGRHPGSGSDPAPVINAAELYRAQLAQRTNFLINRYAFALAWSTIALLELPNHSRATAVAQFGEHNKLNYPAMGIALQFAILGTDFPINQPFIPTIKTPTLKLETNKAAVIILSNWKQSKL